MNTEMTRPPYDRLDDDQMSRLILAFFEVDIGSADEDEAFKDVTSLFNLVYQMGQQHERRRSAKSGDA